MNESLGQVIRLTWDAPFSLDITGVDPDIWYHVDVTVNNSPFSSYNDIYVTEFNFTMDGHSGTNTSVIYEFRVTPINGAGNGTTSDPVTGYFRGCKSINCYDIVVQYNNVVRIIILRQECCLFYNGGIAWATM